MKRDMLVHCESEKNREQITVLYAVGTELVHLAKFKAYLEHYQRQCSDEEGE